MWTLSTFETLCSFSHDVARSLDPVVETTSSSWAIGSVSSRGRSMSAMKFSAMAERPRKAHLHVDLFSLIVCRC